MESLLQSNNDQIVDQSTILSPLDQIMPRFYTRLILCFPAQAPLTENQNSIFFAFETGLKQTLNEIPFLGGVIVNNNNNSGKVHIAPGPGVLLRSKNLTDDKSISYQKLKDAHFPPSSLDGEVLSAVGMMPSESSAPVMAAQINFVQKGILLVLGIHHSAMDAAGFGTVLRTWAKFTKTSFIENEENGDHSTGLGLTLTPNSLDRSPLMGTSTEKSVDPETRIKNHPQYKLEPNPPMSAPSKDTSAAPFTLPPMTTAIFHFPAPKLAQLKSFATPSSSSISTHDALCALLWCSITRARNLCPPTFAEPPSSSMLGFAVDGRRRLNPPLPPSYLGNVNIYASAHLPLATLTDPVQLPATASAIRTAITALDDARIRDILALAASLPLITDLKPGFNTFLGADLAITSWRDMGIAPLDWGEGIGKVESVRIPGAGFDGLCIVLPAMGGQDDAGGWEVLVGLEEGAMGRLVGDGEIEKWADVRCY